MTYAVKPDSGGSGGAVPAFGSPVATENANADGVAATIVRSDHVHARYTAPTKVGWSWQNQGAAAVDESGAAILLSIAPEAPNNIHMRTRPMAAGKQVIAAFSAFDTEIVANARFPSMGIGWTDGTKIITCAVVNNQGNGLLLNVEKFTNATTFSAAVSSRTNRSLLNWIKLTDDGVNRKAFYSPDDGEHWIEFYSEGRTVFLTATSYGILVNSYNETAAVSLRYWAEQ